MGDKNELSRRNFMQAAIWGIAGLECLQLPTSLVHP
jgi:hypothetical protein